MSTGTRTGYVGLGSNLGDRAAAIDRAAHALAATAGIAVTARSSTVETAPVGGPAQPSYLNAVVRVQTSLAPLELLRICQAIEADGGRDRSGEERWGPRPIDLDLLLLGDLVVHHPDLTLPHPRLHERRFVLDLLADIAVGVVHPVLGRSIESLRDLLSPERTAGGTVY